MVGPRLIAQYCSAFTSLCERLDGNCDVVDRCPGPGKWAVVHQKDGNLLLHSHTLCCLFLYKESVCKEQRP